jgi:hypothetical protein
MDREIKRVVAIVSAVVVCGSPAFLIFRHYQPAAQLTAMIHFEVDPVTTTVTVDGKRIGNTPLDAQLKRGLNEVVLESPVLGCRLVATLDVRSDARVTYALPTGWLAIDAPADAKVTVDGQPVSRHTMLTCSGHHQVEATFADGKRVSQQLRVEPALTTTAVLSPNS